jgi:DNA (cytosine-5)-methyltransferase 1
MSNKQVPIIDLFAGPGGLGEGFTSIVDKKNNRFFKIALSIECDDHAHQTLTLRSFLRQFPFKELPKEYYQFVRGEIKIDDLYDCYPDQAEKAKHEAWKFKLGNSETHKAIDRRIVEALKGEKNFMLIGGPPCQAYSLVGRARRQQIAGLNKEDERVYFYRILAVHRPPIFIMENVKGLLSSKVENELIFKQLTNDLEDPIEAYKKLKGEVPIYKSRIGYKIYSLVRHSLGWSDLFETKPLYKPKDFIIRAEDFGIPQTRHRVILLGIRSDLEISPDILKPFGKLIPVDDVLSGLPPLRSGLSKTKDGKQEWKQALRDLLQTKHGKDIESAVWDKMKEVIEKLSLPQKDRGNDFVEGETKIKYMAEWYLDEKLKGACNHQTRSHIREDLYRYLFVSCFAKMKKRSPKLSDFPVSLLPKHMNIGEGVNSNKFADRFRVQMADQPSKTVTSHISKDGHYFIHPDSAQCRSLTVREAARIQTFPDNYFFCGPRTQQFHQVGNAVPPLLAKQIAEIVKKLF